MIGLWEKLYNVLAQDECIVSIVDPLTGGADGGIRRGQQPKLSPFRNCITYREWSGGAPNLWMSDGRRIPNAIYDVPMFVVCWVAEGQGDEPADVKCATLAWCVVHAIEGCDFNYDWCENKGVLVYNKKFDGFQSPVYYDDTNKAQRRDMRFRFTVSECSYKDPLPSIEF